MAPARWIWIRIGGAVLLLVSLAAAWKWTGLSVWLDPEQLSTSLEPYRRSWLALPLVVAVFVVLELFAFPVLVLVFMCGISFGPWLGALYGLTGSVASAIPPFLLGRRLGRARLERLGGSPVRRLERTLERRGVLAIFLVRKIPAPYSLVNLACGASGVSLRDFVLGTLLGMSTGIVLITFLGAQLLEILADPEPKQIAVAAFLLLIPISLALWVQRTVGRLERRT